MKIQQLIIFSALIVASYACNIEANENTPEMSPDTGQVKKVELKTNDKG